MISKFFWGLFFVLSQWGISTAENLPIGGLVPSLKHNWDRIRYPRIAPDGAKLPIFSLNFADINKGGLRIVITGNVAAPSQANSIKAKLYRAGGKIVEPESDSFNHPIGMGSGGYIDWSAMASFAWNTNVLQESWIKVSIGSENYWLEIPYGFDRNPLEELSPPGLGGAPKSASSIMPLEIHDHLVPWKEVHYDLGEIQNHWRLSLIQSNTSGGESEVVLYREDTVIGKSAYLWDLHSPRTALRILSDEGWQQNGFCTQIRLHEDGMRRSDIFRCSRPSANGRRGWAQVEIAVGDKTYRTVLPSSLFLSDHAHASN